MATAKAMSNYVKWRNRPKRRVKLFPVNRHKVANIIGRHLRRGMREIGELEAKEILEAYGFVTPKSMIATTVDQAVNAADQIPVRVEGKGDADWRIPELHRVNPFKLEIEAMIDSIETGKEHVLSGRQGRADLEVLMAIFESSQRREVISLPLG